MTGFLLMIEHAGEKRETAMKRNKFFYEKSIFELKPGSDRCVYCGYISAIDYKQISPAENTPLDEIKEYICEAYKVCFNCDPPRSDYLGKVRIDALTGEETLISE
jgi:hypothetical protein